MKLSFVRNSLLVAVRTLRGGVILSNTGMLECLDKTDIDVLVVTETKAPLDKTKSKSIQKVSEVFINGFTHAEEKERYVEKKNSD